MTRKTLIEEVFPISHEDLKYVCAPDLLTRIEGELREHDISRAVSCVGHEESGAEAVKQKLLDVLTEFKSKHDWSQGLDRDGFGLLEDQIRTTSARAILSRDEGWVGVLRRERDSYLERFREGIDRANRYQMATGETARQGVSRKSILEAVGHGCALVIERFDHYEVFAPSALYVDKPEDDQPVSRDGCGEAEKEALTARRALTAHGLPCTIEILDDVAQTDPSYCWTLLGSALFERGIHRRPFSIRAIQPPVLERLSSAVAAPLATGYLVTWQHLMDRSQGSVTEMQCVAPTLDGAIAMLIGSYDRQHWIPGVSKPVVLRLFGDLSTKDLIKYGRTAPF